MIDGMITDEIPKDEYGIILDTYGILGFAYATHMDSSPRLYLKTLPDFNECITYYLGAWAPLLKIDKKQDICLSLFYNPYFNELYAMIKKCSSKFPRGRKSFLVKYLLSYLADPVRLIPPLAENERDFFLKHNIFDKSREMIEILKD